MTKTEANSVYEFSVKTNRGLLQPMSEYRGRALLIVNTASQCGFTPQYKDLEELHKKYQGRGFSVLGFPCNQFGGQEPGSDAEINQFCQINFGVSFPIFSKIDVNGLGAHPLYEYLKREAKGVLGTSSIKWNFTKFLIGKEGRVIARYAPTTQPRDLEKDIEKALG